MNDANHDPLGPLLDQALEALKNVSGVIATRVPGSRGEIAKIYSKYEINIRIGLLEHRCQAIVTAAHGPTVQGGLSEQLNPRDRPGGVLVLPHITTDAADRLRGLGIQFVDTAGNAHLRTRDLFVYVTGRRPDKALLKKQHPATTAASGTRAALRIMFVLLCDPNLVKGTYREIAHAAGVALGGVGSIMEDLSARGLIVHAARKENRHLLQPEKLLQEWVINYPTRLRPKLRPQRFRAPDRDWWKSAEISRHHAQWGGEVAADRYLGYLRPATVTIYADPAPALRSRTRLIIENRLQPDPAGEVEFLDRFWTLAPRQTNADLVPAALVYADLMATIDPRNIEVARMLHGRLLADESAEPAQAT